MRAGNQEPEPGDARRATKASVRRCDQGRRNGQEPGPWNLRGFQEYRLRSDPSGKGQIRERPDPGKARSGKTLGRTKAVPNCEP
jgi:hypothetical protein